MFIAPARQDFRAPEERPVERIGTTHNSASVAKLSARAYDRILKVRRGGLQEDWTTWRRLLAKG